MNKDPEKTPDESQEEAEDTSEEVADTTADVHWEGKSMGYGDEEERADDD